LKTPEKTNENTITDRQKRQINEYIFFILGERYGGKYPSGGELITPAVSHLVADGGNILRR
jgi:hypothetical protein